MLGINVQFNIISYAVISTKFEASSSLLESFLPLVEHALSCVDKDYIEEININNTYEEIYGYRIHSAILSQLLKILQKQGKIERLKRESIQINKSTLKSYDMKEEYALKLRALISEIEIFCKRKGHDVKREIIPKAIIEFLQKNAIDFNSFISYQSNMENFDEEEILLNDMVEFLLEARRNDTRHYEFVKEIFAGIILSSIIISNEEIVSSFKEDFRVGNVLLDSNYIFRLLDLQTSLEFQAAQDTYDALSNTGCNFWVCKETVKQIADTIRAIVSNCTETANTVLRLYGDDRFTGLASACVRRSLTAAKLEGIIDELEDTLKNKYKVNFIDENEFNIDLIELENDKFNSLQQIKIDSSETSIAHDLLLVHVVSSKRSKTLYKADKADWWVLTDDNKLTNWNVKNSVIRDIPECITEAQLATVMWLCNPKTASLDGLFNTVIALRSQGLVGNCEYVKISKEIERQKERLSDDGPKLKKLSLVLSQRMLSVDELLGEDRDEMDAKFDQMLLLSQEKLEEKENEIEKQAQCIREEKKKSDELSLKVQGTVSLLTEQTEKLLASLKARKEDKQLQYDTIQNNIIDLKEKETKRINRFGLALRLIFIGILIFVFYRALPFINSLETWYSNHQLLCLILTGILSAITVCLGLKLELIIKFSKRIAKGVIALFVKIKFVNNISCEIKELGKQEDQLMTEMLRIQEDIDNELAK